MKTFLKLIGVLLILGLLLAGSANLWVPRVLELGLEQYLSVQIEVGSFNANVFRGYFSFHDVRIKNPPGYDGYMAFLNQATVDVNVKQSLKKEKIDVRSLVLDIKEAVIIRNKSSATNVTALGRDEDQGAETGKLINTENRSKFYVDYFSLSVDTVKYIDGFNPFLSKTVRVNLNHEFRGITSSKDIFRIILMRVIYSASLGNLGLPIDEWSSFLLGKIVDTATVVKMVEKI